MADKTQTTSGGIGLGGALFILFLALKLTGVINWSWLWVFAPLWIPAGIVAVCIGFLLIAALVCKLLK